MTTTPATTIGRSLVSQSSSGSSTLSSSRHPRVGFGTYTLGGSVCDQALETAFSCGYRLVDTASGYKNEQVVGGVINRMIEDTKSTLMTALTRESIWITTKISPNALKCPESALKVEIQNIMESAKKLVVGELGAHELSSKRDREESGDTATATISSQPISTNKLIHSNKRSTHGCTSPYTPANAPPAVREEAFIRLVTHSVRQSCYESIVNLGTGYLDVLMLHWPAIGGRPVKDPLNIVLRNHVLLEMTKLTAMSTDELRGSLGITKRGEDGECKENGNCSVVSPAYVVRYVAVSNFKVRHLEAFREFIDQREAKNKTIASPDCRHPIHIHQFELHPLCRQRSIVRYCISHGISVQQYSPLGSAGEGVTMLLELPCVRRASSDLSTSLRRLQRNLPAVNDAMESCGDVQVGVDSNKESEVFVTPAQMCLLWGFWFFQKEARMVAAAEASINNNLHRYAPLIPPHSSLPRSQTPSRIIENFQVQRLWDTITQLQCHPEEDGKDGSNNQELKLIAIAVESIFSTLEEALLEQRMILKHQQREKTSCSNYNEEAVVEISGSGCGSMADYGSDEWDHHFCWESSKVL